MSKYPFHYDMPRLAGDMSEVGIQKQCRDAVAKCFDAETWAIPNGGKRTRWAATRAKIEGLHTGAPDLLIVGGKRNAGRVAFIEVKARQSLGTEQKDTLLMLHRSGHDCGVFRSAHTLVMKLKDWGWQ